MTELVIPGQNSSSVPEPWILLNQEWMDFCALRVIANMTSMLNDTGNELGSNPNNRLVSIRSEITAMTDALRSNLYVALASAGHTSAALSVNADLTILNELQGPPLEKIFGLSPLIVDISPHLEQRRTLDNQGTLIYNYNRVARHQLNSESRLMVSADNGKTSLIFYRKISELELSGIGLLRYFLNISNFLYLAAGQQNPHALNNQLTARQLSVIVLRNISTTDLSI